MKTKEIIVTNEGKGMEEALAGTEQLGIEKGLSSKEKLHLRLLAEELFGMIRSITSAMEAKYYIEYENKSFRIYLETEVEELTREMRKELLSVSSSGANAAAKGFMGKLKDMVSASLLPSEDATGMVTANMMNMGCSTGYHAEGAFEWTMAQYIETIKSEQGDEAAEAWDELEKSIIANIADNISIFINKLNVKIEISKTFK